MRRHARRLVAGTGWKMNNGAAAAAAYGRRLAALLDGRPVTAIDAYVLPPFTSLHAAREAFAGTGVAIGGQTMHWEEEGAWTGEISAPMLREAGCRYVALAHSERLAHFNESYDRVRLKMNAAFAHGLTPVLCLGETAEEKREGRADAVLALQVETAFADQPAEAVPGAILAYEPRWAIGAAAAASPDYVAERHGALRALVGERYGEAAAAATRIVYGGSVTAGNGPAIVALEDVDGLFVGRAAWTADGFFTILGIVGDAARAKGHAP
jgi:triosephosphate isomerase